MCCQRSCNVTLVLLTPRTQGLSGVPLGRDARKQMLAEYKGKKEKNSFKTINYSSDSKEINRPMKC